MALPSKLTLQIIFALLRKNIKERLRCCGRTCCELISAVLVFSILVLLEMVLKNELAIFEQLNGYHASTSTRSFEPRPAVVLFSPDTNMTRKLMTHVCSPQSTSGLYGYNITCYCFHNEMEMWQEAWKIKLTGLVAAIVFENINNQLPKTLQYTFYYASRRGHNHTSYFIDFFGIEHLEVPNIQFFSNVEWAVDKYYLEHISGGTPIYHTVKLVEERRDHLTKEKRFIHTFLITCSIIAPLPFFLYNSSRLIRERRSGLRGLVKLQGVDANMIRSAYLMDSFIYSIIYGCMVTLVLKIQIKDQGTGAILPYSNWFLLIVHFIFQLLNITTFTFVVSASTQGIQQADSIALLSYVMSFMLNILWYAKESHTSFFAIICSCFLPHAPLFLFWDTVTTYEANGVGLQFHNLFSRYQKTMPVILTWLFYIIQMVLCYALVWYLDYVCPGSYGVAIPWNFCLKKNFWKRVRSKKKGKRRKVNFHATAEKVQILKDNRFFEPGPANAEVAIKVCQVTKVYKGFRNSTTALDNVTLDIYQGEITVILGANGAGKTTLMSIIAGLTQATTGTVYVNGLDTSARIQEISKDMGFCPQKDLTFDYLTVKENIEFFERLKTGTKTISNADAFIEKFNLLEDVDAYSYEIDSGAKRCLQVACALVGQAEVIILDEPTSSMDARLRHVLWDELLTLRGGKTVLLATTCMEEADALGDRIALLNHGKLKCYGRPAFLKAAIGADKFNVTVNINGDSETIDVFSKALNDAIPEIKMATIQSKLDISKVTIGLPDTQRNVFPQVFDFLQSRKTELGISSLRVGMCMEEAFTRFIEEDEAESFNYNMDEFNHYESQALFIGCRLWIQQVLVLMGRSFHYIWSEKYKFLILQFLIPFLGLIVVSASSNASSGYGKMYYPLNTTKEPIVVYQQGGGYRRADVLTPLSKMFPDIEFRNQDVSKKNYTAVSAIGKNRNVYGLDMNMKGTIVYHPDSLRTTFNKAMNIFSNMFLSVHIPYTQDHRINVDHQPLKSKAREPKNGYMCVVWAIWASFMVTITLPPFILLSIEEYYSGVRFRHIVAGCSPIIVWYSKLAVHFLMYSAIVPASMLFSAGLLDRDKTLDRGDFLSAIFLFLLAFGPAFLMQLYALSFLLDPAHVVAHINIMALFFTTVTPLVAQLTSMLTETGVMNRILSMFIYVLFHLSPACALASGITKLTYTAKSNAYCSMNYYLCPNNYVATNPAEKLCCYSENPNQAVEYYTVDTGLIELLTFVAQFFFYSIVVMMLQQRILQNLAERLLNYMYKEMSHEMEDETITEEKAFVKEKYNQFKKTPFKERKPDPVAFLAYNVHKKCTSRGSADFHCHNVDGVSFSLERGDVLCIVGKNASGKSSLLNMLSGYMVMTKGDLYSFGYFIREERKKYIHKLAISRPTQEMDQFLTGFENLRLLSRLHGRQSVAADHLALHYLQYMGLHSYIHARASSYTPGCARLLGLAGALATTARLDLLDSPTAAVDPYTRPLIHRAVLRLRERKCVTVIAEYNIEWRDIEQICTRLALMKSGRFAAIGSVRELRDKMAPGFAIIIKLTIDSAYVICEDSIISLDPCTSSADVKTGSSALRRAFPSFFPYAELKEQHLTMLYYHIREAKLSELFIKMEELKGMFSDVIEDYTINETSVEQVIRNLEERGLPLPRRRRLSIASNLNATPALSTRTGPPSNEGEQ